ncbi:hypothetical protein D3C76_1401360 [compost metagenome]
MIARDMHGASLPIVIVQVRISFVSFIPHWKRKEFTGLIFWSATLWEECMPDFLLKPTMMK